MPETENYQPSKTTLYLNDLQTTLFFELGTDEDTVGGPMLMPMCYTVNFFKGFTFVWVVALMLYFQNYSKAMILYLCLHGTYGFCWVIKDFVFPDARAQKMGTVCSHVLLFTLLVFYWMIPIPLAMSLGNQNPSILSMCLYVVVYLTGLVLMMGSDYQKYHSLKVKKGLVSTGFFKYTRNPNYLGQILIYLSFCLCSGHILSFFFFFFPAGILFTLNIYLKEQMSFKLKKGFEEYAKQSNILLWKIVDNKVVDWSIYLGIFVLTGYLYSQSTSNKFFYPFDQPFSDL